MIISEDFAGIRLDRKNNACQTDITLKEASGFEAYIEEQRLKNLYPRTPVSQKILTTEARARMLTGIDKFDRETLWIYFKNDRDNLTMIDQNYTSGQMSISVGCQFLLTLAILRRNYKYCEASELFNVGSERLVSLIFRTWCVFMDRKFRLVLIIDPNRVSFQGVKSLGGHFACLCRGFKFYEVKKKKCYYF